MSVSEAQPFIKQTRKETKRKLEDSVNGSFYKLYNAIEEMRSKKTHKLEEYRSGDQKIYDWMKNGSVSGFLAVVGDLYHYIFWNKEETENLIASEAERLGSYLKKRGDFSEDFTRDFLRGFQRKMFTYWMAYSSKKFVDHIVSKTQDIDRDLVEQGYTEVYSKSCDYIQDRKLEVDRSELKENLEKLLGKKLPEKTELTE